MPQSTVDSHLSLDLSIQPALDPIPEGDEQFFPIAILADFSGRSTRHADTSSAPGIPVRINCDNFETVFERFGPVLRLKAAESAGNEAALQFAHIDDFHPDRLIHQIVPLERLFDLRFRLLDPAHAEAAVAEARSTLNLNAPATGTAVLPATPTETTEELLKRLLGKSDTPKPESPPAASTVERLLKQIVTPNVVPGATAEQSDLVRLIENDLSTRLREVLHNADFQALEATWRGIDFLVRQIGDQIGLYLVDISKAELAAQISAGELTKTVIFKQLEQIGPSVVLGMFTFGPGDQLFLGSLASLMDRLRTSFVAGAAPQMVGCRSFGSQPDPDDWATEAALHEFDALRRMPESSHLGLLMPSFLLRQPYGTDSDPIEAFNFQEIVAPSEHESYLWGNSCVLCGYLLADAFAAEGWDFVTRGGGQVFGLPVHTLTAAGETEAKPCAEAWLSERAVEAILEHGIMPVTSIRGRDAVEIRALKSFAKPATPLIIR
jgi:type VI secretion system protein ImpC